MNRRTFLAGCSTLLGLATPAFSGEPTKPDIARLVKQLGSDRFREREAAARALEKAGKAAVPALRRVATHHPDAEVRRRAGRLVAKYDECHVAEHVQSIIKNKLSPVEKGRQIKPLLHLEMPEVDVVKLLGHPTRSFFSLGDKCSRYENLGLAIWYTHHTKVGYISTGPGF